MEGFRVADTNLIIYIHPSKANKVKQAVFCQLSSSLFQFDEAFSGVLLAFEISFQDKTAKLLPGIAPYLSVRAKAKLLIFSPKPDMLLEGKVVKLGRESIHVIVLGFSSAVITSDDIREEFRYNIKHGEEVFASLSHKKHVIKVGTMLRFSVKSFDEDILHICGSLVPTDTGSISWLSKHSREGALPHSNLTQEKSETGSISQLSKHSREGALPHSNLTQEKSETGSISRLNKHSRDGALPHNNLIQEKSETGRSSKKLKDYNKGQEQELDSIDSCGRGMVLDSERPHKSKKRRTSKS